MNKNVFAIAAAVLVATSGLASARPTHTAVRTEQAAPVHAKAHSLRNSYNSYGLAPSDSLAGEEFYGLDAYHHPGDNDWDAYQQDD